MKKSISILFCLFMFPLFLNTTLVKAQGVPTNPSPDPKLIMDSATLTLPLHKRIAELEGLLADANAKRDSSRQKIEDLNRQLSEGNDAQERLKTRVADLTFQYTNLKGQYTTQTVDRDADQVEIVRLKTELSKAQSQSANKDDEIARLNTELSTEKANAANAAGEIARLKTELSKAQSQSANKDDEIARLKELLTEANMKISESQEKLSHATYERRIQQGTDIIRQAKQICATTNVRVKNALAYNVKHVRRETSITIWETIEEIDEEMKKLKEKF